MPGPDESSTKPGCRWESGRQQGLRDVGLSVPTGEGPVTPWTVIPTYQRLSVAVGLSCLCPWCAAFAQLLMSEQSWECSPSRISNPHPFARPMQTAAPGTASARGRGVHRGVGLLKHLPSQTDHLCFSALVYTWEYVFRGRCAYVCASVCVIMHVCLHVHIDLCLLCTRVQACPCAGVV